MEELPRSACGSLCVVGSGFPSRVAHVPYCASPRLTLGGSVKLPSGALYLEWESSVVCVGASGYWEVSGFFSPVCVCVCSVTSWENVF